MGGRIRSVVPAKSLINRNYSQIHNFCVNICMAEEKMEIDSPASSDLSKKAIWPEMNAGLSNKLFILNIDWRSNHFQFELP